MKKLLNYSVLLLILNSCKTKDPLPNRAPEPFVVSTKLLADGKSILLNWTKAKDPDGDPVKYTVVLKDTLVKDLVDTTFTIKNLAYDFTQNGNIIAKDTKGLKAESKFTITTSKAPTLANFTFDILANGEVNFKNTTLNATKYLWKFGDESLLSKIGEPGGTSTVKEPQYFYKKNQKYQVELIATVDGKNYSVIKEVTISTIPANQAWYGLNYSQESFKSVVSTPDGGFIAAGFYDVKPSLMKFNNIGEPEWRSNAKDREIGSEFSAVVSTSDGNYFAISNFSNKGLVIKFDKDGVEMWRKSFSKYYLNKIKITSDGNLILSGLYLTKYDSDAYNTDLLNSKYYAAALKIDSKDGFVIWQFGENKAYTGNNVLFKSEFKDVTELSNNTYALVGSQLLEVKNNNSFYNPELMVRIIDKNGAFLKEYTKRRESVGTEYAAETINSVKENGNNIVIGGQFYKPGGGGIGPYIAILNKSSLENLKEFYFDASNTSSLEEIILDRDNNYLIAGYSNSEKGILGANNGGKSPYEGWVCKMDKELNLIKTSFFGGKGIDRFYALTRLKDNSIMVAGSTNTPYLNYYDANYYDAWLIKLADF